MIRRILASLVAAAVLCASLAGCGAAVAPIQTVEGLVLEVVGDSPADIDSFTIRTAQAERLLFSLDGVDLSRTGFPATHLREHQALAQPVRVTYRVEGETNVVVRLEDAD